MDSELKSDLKEQIINSTFVVVGGGIAGVTCAETLAICCPKESIILVTESNVVKSVTNVQSIARYLQKFDVNEITTKDAEKLHQRIHYIVDQLKHIAVKEKKIFTSNDICISYEHLCICTGARPHLIDYNNKYVIGIRDTDSVVELQKRLQNASSVIIVGNGGIATELVYKLKNIEIHWIIKDEHMTSTFLDPAAAAFVEKARNSNFSSIPGQENDPNCFIKRWRYEELSLETKHSSKTGSALGPDWHQKYELSGSLQKSNHTTPIMHNKKKVKSIKSYSNDESRAEVELFSGEKIICDFIISATGVEPYVNFTSDEKFHYCPSDKGILVNELMQTNLTNIYAAGDVCTAGWPHAEHWFQMRLWTQARQMGSMAGRSMAAAFEGVTIYQDFCFELFGHVTELFGFPLVLLGRYNSQGLNNDYELLIRTTPNQEYIKFVIKDGRLRGALLIGNTDLAETCENLILNAIDLTPFGDNILNPDIDIEDYFD